MTCLVPDRMCNLCMLSLSFGFVYKVMKESLSISEVLGKNVQYTHVRVNLTSTLEQRRKNICLDINRWLLTEDTSDLRRPKQCILSSVEIIRSQWTYCPVLPCTPLHSRHLGPTIGLYATYTATGTLPCLGSYLLLLHIDV